MKTKTLNFEETKNIFVEFVLSSEEMIKIRGGADAQVKPCNPPVQI